jgi:fatty-acyl-CoA synthase
MFDSNALHRKVDETVGRILLRRLEEEPNGEACRLVSRDGEVVSVSMRSLIERAMAYASAYGPASPDRKIIGVCLYSGLDLHAAFLGAIWAGHIPTMLAPPSPRMEPGKYIDSFCRMLRHVRPSYLVVDTTATERFDRLALRDFPEATLIDPANVPAADGVDPWAGKADEVALLQHSSGTTGLQKGVALTHQAIIKHNFVYAERLSPAGDDRIVSWLPLYHDMGLIACFMLPLLLRIPFVEISPFDWVLRPASLLEQIHRQRGTLCWLPDFAFRFMAESVRLNELPPDLNLTSIRAWVNCSEPVYHSAHVAFYNRFREYGVNWQQFTASYAMAENVFAVTQSLPGDYRVLRVNRRVFSEAHRIELDDSDGSLEFVSNGRPVAGTEVSVIDKDGKPMAENAVGEIAIRGDCRFAGYFRRDDLTKQSLIGEGWFQTGDLGFVHDGEIYVTGRKKDLIIIQGRNFYPADIETIVSEIDGVVPGRAVAFGVPNENTGTELLIVIAETIDHRSEQARHLALRIRNVVAQELDCIPADVRVVPTRWLIKSTSGKLARADNRNKYLENFVKEDRVTPAYV